MTAINVILTRRAAHVITDGAITDPSGKLLMIAPKAHPLAHSGAVIAVRGSKEVAMMIADSISRSGVEYDHSSYDKIKASIGKLINDLLTGKDSASLDQWFGHSWRDMDIVVAGWSDSLRRPDAFFLVTHGNHPGVTPFSIIDPGPYLITPTSSELLLEFQKRAEEVNDNNIDTLAADLIARQRDLEPNVGCFAQVTSVTSTSVMSRIVSRFSDKIGETRMPLAA